MYIGFVAFFLFFFRVFLGHNLLLQNSINWQLTKRKKPFNAELSFRNDSRVNFLRVALKLRL